MGYSEEKTWHVLLALIVLLWIYNIISTQYLHYKLKYIVTFVVET